MVNYLAWAKADPLTGEQAARLWAEIDPSTPSYMLTPEQAATIAARLQMISGKITIGALKADTHANGFAFIGRHESSLITREALKALAISVDERPAFLFDQPVSGDAAAEASGPERVALPRNVEPTPSANTFDDFMSGLKGERSSAAKPTPLRVVPGARRISQAPPPLTYLRGDFVVGPPRTEHAMTVPASSGSGQTPRATGRKRTQREAVCAWLAEKYPGGVPRHITTDALVAELKGDKIIVSARTVSRAMGRQ